MQTTSLHSLAIIMLAITTMLLSLQVGTLRNRLNEVEADARWHEAMIVKIIEVEKQLYGEIQNQH